MQAVLVDTASSTGPTVSSVATISRSGQELFAVFVGGGPAPPPPLLPPGPYTEARLFRNRCGHLDVVATLLMDATASGVLGGGASPDFTRFVVIDAVERGRTRIRAFDRTLSVPLATADLPEGEFVILQHVGFLSNRLVAIPLTHPTRPPPPPLSATPASRPPPIVQSLIQVRDIDHNLALVASVSFAISETLTDLAAFALDDGTLYVAALLATLESNMETAISARLVVLQLIAGTLLEVATAPLPATGYAVTALARGCSARIGVGTGRATLPGEVSTYGAPQPTLVTGDGQELRLYRFRPGRLHLVASANPDADVTAVGIDPQDPSLLMVAVRTEPLGFFNPTDFVDEGSSVPNLAQLYRVGRRRHSDPRLGKEIAAEGRGLIVSNETFTAQFGGRRYLVVSGCKGPQNTEVPAPELFLGYFVNVRLYRLDCIRST